MSGPRPETGSSLPAACSSRSRRRFPRPSSSFSGRPLCATRPTFRTKCRISGGGPCFRASPGSSRAGKFDVRDPLGSVGV